MTKRGDFDRTLQFVRCFVEEHGYSPSHVEIRDGAGLSSVSVVSYHLNRLMSLGRVTFEPGLTRTVRPL